MKKMMDEQQQQEQPVSKHKSRFERAGEDVNQGNLAKEFLDFLAHNKKWWLLPIVLLMLAFGLLLILGAGPAAPFIYTLF